MVADWITSTPTVLGGKPCIRGTRISVEIVLELLENGASQEDIRRAYPDVPGGGISAAIEYASSPTRARVGGGIEAKPGLGDLMAAAGPWEGESTEELIRILREGRDAGGSTEPPENL